MIENIKKLDEFKSIVKENKILIVFFWEGKVGLCESISAVFDNFSQNFKEVKPTNVKVDTEKGKEISPKFNIESEPSFLLLIGRLTPPEELLKFRNVIKENEILLPFLILHGIHHVEEFLSSL